MSAVNLIMPMAGRGSRFAAQGIREPKPLIELNGMPFFWWAVESARRAFEVSRMVFVVLEEHIVEWSIDRSIHWHYPDAQIVALPDITSGSAETAALGCAALDGSAPLMINDCDHAFVADAAAGARMKFENASGGALMTFPSQSPNYSYVQLATDGSVIGTVEKKVASPYAIAGCYLFASTETFKEQYAKYIKTCPYTELFVSGIYNQMVGDGFTVDQVVLREHFAFGTPDEYADVRSRMDSRLAGWRRI